MMDLRNDVGEVVLKVSRRSESFDPFYEQAVRGAARYREKQAEDVTAVGLHTLNAADP
jgi:hypothetical protein